MDSFIQTVWDYYDAHGRHDLPWRLAESGGTFDPYKILVSEFMLQQTQVARVIPKYNTFVTQFPTVSALGAATLGEVLRAWQGLGYNRRAKFLWQTAHELEATYQGEVPRTLAGLATLPGIGRNTAGAIMTYAFNEPTVFIETNIRTVYIHHFFHDQTAIPDATLMPLLSESLHYASLGSSSISPRVWYWALMDYGSYLKQTVGNLSQHSKMYVKQSAYVGSRRQLRGRVLRLLSNGAMTAPLLRAELGDSRAAEVLDVLEREGFIRQEEEIYRLA